MDEEIRVISLWQPWAWWVMLGWKSIETRRHARFACIVSEWLGIHAAQKWDDAATNLAAPWLTVEQFRRTQEYRRNYTRGALLGKVWCSGNRWLDSLDSKRALIDCSTGKFGLFLNNVDEFKTPIPMRGKQGIWIANLGVPHAR